MKPINIAIADDHTLFREGLKLIINCREDFKLVHEAVNGQILLDELASSKVLPDVILLDLKMPVKDGIETTREIKELYAEVKIIILTMIDQDDYILHLLDIGASGYLLKNSPASEVEEAIEGVAAKGFYFNHRVSQVMLSGLKQKKKTPKSLDPLTKISARELEVCELMAEGLTTNEIADRLFISSRTVETHRKNLMEKLEVKNSAGIIYKAVKEGLLK